MSKPPAESEVTRALCFNCGADIVAGTNFCSRCGARVGPLTTGELPPVAHAEPGPAAMWYVIIDRMAEDQRKALYAIMGEMNFREAEISPFGEKGNRIDRKLALVDANTVMARLLEAGIAPRKIRS